MKPNTATLTTLVAILSAVASYDATGVDITPLNTTTATTNDNSTSKDLTEGRSATSSQSPNNRQSARGGRMLDLEVLSGDVGRAEKIAKDKSLSGERQSRILNDDIVASMTSSSSGEQRNSKKQSKRMQIKGFIPILSIEGAMKDGKHFDLGDATGESELDQSQDEPQSGDQHQQQGTRSQLLSNYGGKTSIGHASFPGEDQPQAGSQQVDSWANQQQQQQLAQKQQQQQWSGVNNDYVNSEDSDIGLRANRKLPGSQLMNGPKRLVSTLVSTMSPFAGLASHHNNQQQIRRPPSEAEACVCVPFFQCKNGYLNERQLSRTQLQQILTGPTPAGLSQQSSVATMFNPNVNLFSQQQQQYHTPRALNEQAFNGISAPSESTYNSLQQPQQPPVEPSISNSQSQYQGEPTLSPSEQQAVMNQIYEQIRKNLESGQLDSQQQQQLIASAVAASGQPAQYQYDERSAPTNASATGGDVQERGFLSQLNPIAKRTSAGQPNCGIMRTCCKLPLALAASQKQQQPGGGQLGLMPPANLVHNQMLQQHQMLSPMRSGLVQNNNRLQQQYEQQGQFALMRPQQQPSLIDQSLANENTFAHYQTGAASSVKALGLPVTNYNNQHQQQQQQQLQRPATPTGSFMAGRCGAREALGIGGRVQNSQLAPGSESTADFGEFPSHAAILKRISPGESLFVCSAALISNQWLATAAHCVRKLRPEDIKVRLGEWDVSRDDELYPFVEANIREMLVHPDFQPSSLANDLALLRMDINLDAQQAPHVAPACLASPDESFSGQRCWLAGWGKDAFGQSGSFQSQLKKVDLPVFSRQDCELALRYQTKLGKMFRLHQSNICAGGERGKDACEGDGGAGLYCLDAETGLAKMVGLVSWGVGCGQRGVPGVYTSIGALQNWIEQAIVQSGEENLYLDRNLISERSNAKQLAANATIATNDALESRYSGNSSTSATGGADGKLKL